jgi:hypothetical protein
MIPGSIGDVTPFWLSDVLGRDVESIEVTQIGQGVGLMGDIFKIGLMPEGQVPESIVVKLPSSFEENRQQGINLGMFDAEIRFYDQLAPKVKSGLPVIYHSEIQPGTAEFVVVMEDLSDLTLVDQRVGMTLDQAAAAVKILAAIHATWWNDVKNPDMEWIPSMDGPRIEFVTELMPQILPTYLEAFAASLPEGGVELMETFSTRYLAVNSTVASRSPWTLAHQDYRVENLLFGPPGSDQVVVLDWQGIGRGPGAYDLGYLLGGSLDTQLRRDNETNLVRTYHNILVAEGVSDYSFDQLWEDYAMSHLQGGLATSLVTGGSLDLSNERGKQLVVTMSTRHITAALDHDGMNRLLALDT